MYYLSLLFYYIYRFSFVNIPLLNNFQETENNTYMNYLVKFLKKQHGNNIPAESPKNESAPADDVLCVTGNINADLKNIKEFFGFGISGDIKIREFNIGKEAAFILFIEGMVNTTMIDDNILSPLMLLSEDSPTKDQLLKTFVTHNQAVTEKDFKKISQSVNFGDCAIFVNGIEEAIICDVKTWDRRGIDAPLTDAVIIGPHEGFNENFKINTALVRKIIRSENLLIENLLVGNQSNTPCAFMYMKNIANQKFVKELKQRITNIDVDYLYQVGELEQLIEDNTFSLLPQMLKTERPDKTAEALIEGKIAIILQGSPFALILPTTATELFTTPEDKYLRFPYSFFVRCVRLLGISASVLLPAIYLSLVNFHHEMIPTELLFAIESTRESIPFSAALELIIMELSFDLIKEASIRVPSPIGSTLGIIGGLIIGQAAVSANIVSPITIIVVALAGIGAFATPDYSASFGLRIARYIFTLSASLLGFIGISLCLFLSLSSISCTESLGVSLFEPFKVASTEKSLKYIFPTPLWKKEFRHNYLLSKHKRLQGNISRKWVNK